MKKKLILFICFVVVNLKSFSQSTLITPGSTLPNITSTSTTNGFVLPRMTTTQKESIATVMAGMMVYDTDLNCVSTFNGLEWVCLNVSTSSNLPMFLNMQFNLNPSGNAPLAGQIAIKSNQAVKVSYTVLGQDGEDFTFSNDKFSKDTTINVYALYANFNNTITVTITNQANISSTRTFKVQTGALPNNLPQSSEIIVNSRNNNALTKFILCFPNKISGTFAPVDGAGGHPAIIDNYGKIRGYMNFTISGAAIMIPLLNGNWLLTSETSFKEIDLIGNVYREITLPFEYHHDVFQLPNGNLMYLGQSNLNNTLEDKIYTLDYNSGAIIDSLNLYTLLDPTRQQLPAGPPNDWFHANSLTYDAIDNAILISGRNQSTVVKIDLATKQVKWILADPTFWSLALNPYLLTPNGLGFEQQWGQHSVVLKPNDNHTIMLFDNGNDRSYSNPILPVNNYSRLVEYTIDEANKTVTQNYQFGKEYGAALYAPYVGKVEYINNDRFFLGNGGIRKDANGNATGLGPAKNEVRLFEVDRAQNVYFDISIKTPSQNNPNLVGFLSYRSYPFIFK